MQLFNKFFAKKKYDFEDDEMVWKRTETDTAYNIHQSQPTIKTEPNDMVMPKQFTSKINQGLFENKTSQSTKSPNRISRISEPQQNQYNNSYRNSNNMGQGYDPYGNDQLNNFNAVQDDMGGYSPQGQGYDPYNYNNFNTNPRPNANSYPNNNYNTNGYGNGYVNNDYSQNDYNSGQKNYTGMGMEQEQAYGTPFNRNAFKMRNVSNTNAQWGQVNPVQPMMGQMAQVVPMNQGYMSSPQKDRNVKPELRDYYNIEESIMRKMMQSKETERQQTTKNVNVFGAKSKIPTEKATNHLKEAMNRNNKPPMLNNQLPKEVKIRKNLIFKAVDNENQSEHVEVEQQPTGDMFQMESQYMGKSMEELQQILREKNAKLAQLEEQNFQLVNNDSNITFIQKQINELERETAKLREKNSHLETEQRLLYEELMTKKDMLNELEVSMAKAPPMDQPDTQFKKDLIDKIAKNQQYINDINKKLSSYEEGKNKEIEDIKKNSDKNMQMELEEIKINIMNYDDELLKWMRYFETKVATNAPSNLLDQSVF